MLTIAIALAAAAVSAPEPKSEPSPARPVAEAAAPAAKSDTKRVCAKMGQVTGSQFSRRICLTREQWAARGLELPN
jgi:hypothetical protein